MFVDHFTLGEQRPDYLVNLERKAQKCIDRVKNLEAHIDDVDWHEFDVFYETLEKARNESIEAQRAYINAQLDWSRKQFN